MITKVIKEVGPFLLLLLLFTGVISFMLVALHVKTSGDETDYKGLHAISYFLYALRNSLGDFEVD